MGSRFEKRADDHIPPRLGLFEALWSDGIGLQLEPDKGKRRAWKLLAQVSAM